MLRAACTQGDSARSAALPRKPSTRCSKESRSLPAPPDPGRPRASELPEPARLLGLRRCRLRPLRARRRLAERRSPPALARRRPLADRRPDRARDLRLPRLARGARPPDPAPAGPAGGGARRPHGGAPRARRRRPRGGGDESVRPRLPPAVAPHLALATAGARQPALGPPRRALPRFRRPGAPGLVVRRPVRARLGG